MPLDKPYKDVPGTTIFDADMSRMGYHLNQFCMSLMKAPNRERFKANERAYLDEWAMTEDQKQAVLGGQTLGCTRYVFPSFSWGYSECLPPCMQSPGTTTPFKDIYEALSVSAGKHNYKFGGAYSNYKTHEYASPTPLGVWITSFTPATALAFDPSKLITLPPNTGGRSSTA